MTTLAEMKHKEKVIREKERRHQLQRTSLYEFIKKYWEIEKKQPLDENWHIKAICDALEKVYTGETKRLIINMPPRSLKTEIVSKAFPVWCLWHEPNLKFIQTSYSAWLAHKNSGGARDMYNSVAYGRIFPRRSPIKEDQNTKGNWELEAWGQVYATGSTGTIIGIGADIIIMDDPMKPDDANSELMISNVINNYQDTIKSRLNNRAEWAIVLIMQRLHDNDLAWYLMDLEAQWLWEKWEKLIIPAIDEKGNSFFEKRFPIEMLRSMQKETPVTFSTQYMQEPVNAETQEFHQEWFRYYTEVPKWWRIFTAVDPAFSKSETADNSSIVTGMFKGMDLYVLEYTFGKFNPAELIDKMIYHHRKRNPEKIGIESFQAQEVIGFNLKAEMQRQWLYPNIEEIRQAGDKFAKIRSLIPLYRNWHIFHTVNMQELEHELLRFPRGRHDDIADSLQMLYNMYKLTPNTNAYTGNIEIKYWPDWSPILIQDSYQWALKSEYQL